MKIGIVCNLVFNEYELKRGTVLRLVRKTSEVRGHGDLSSQTFLLLNDGWLISVDLVDSRGAEKGVSQTRFT